MAERRRQDEPWPNHASRRSRPRSATTRQPRCSTALGGGMSSALNIFTTLAHHPRLLKKWSEFGGVLLYRGELDPREREIVILRTGWNCQSDYEFGQHRVIGSRSGMTEKEVDATTLDPDAAGWSDERTRCSSPRPTNCTPTRRSPTTTWAAAGAAVHEGAADRTRDGRRPVPPRVDGAELAWRSSATRASRGSRTHDAASRRPPHRRRRRGHPHHRRSRRARRQRSRHRRAGGTRRRVGRLRRRQRGRRRGDRASSSKPRAARRR